MWFLRLFRKNRFDDSASYWEKRYVRGRNSGDGSYGELAEFKARIINSFISKNRIKKVIEFGCGDGNQLSLLKYESYLGFDVSSCAVNKCREIFSSDSSKRFELVDDYNGENADLTLSLDVIYHLVEDDVFESYMQRLFISSNKYVIVYSNNVAQTPPKTKPHVRWRKFTDWVEKNCSGWELIEVIKNDYPQKSISDFFIYKKCAY
jgi:SAM-dependent methyltransferase